MHTNTGKKPVSPTGLVAKNTPYRTQGIPWTDWSDEEFLNYVEDHSKTERALFSVKMLWRLYALAHEALEGSYSETAHLQLPYEVAKPLVDAARRSL